MVKAGRHLRVLPETRGDCPTARPCPFVTCRHHLLLDIGEDGRLLKARDFDEHDESVVDVLCEMDETCALDVAGRGGITAREVGVMVGICREEVQRCISEVGDQLDRDEFDERKHPDDPYLKYSDMGADDLAELAALLRARQKGDKRG